MRTLLPVLALAVAWATPSCAWVTTELASRTPSGSAGNDSSFRPAASADGRYVAFGSFASDLVPDDTSGHGDVFVLDRGSGVMARASLAFDGAEGDADSGLDVALSSDGRFVVFLSRASNLVPDDTNGHIDVFVRDRLADTIERASVDGPASDWDSYAPSISRDGSAVAFVRALGETPFDEDGTPLQVLVRDRAAATTTVAGIGFEAALSDDGRYVAFTSESPALVDGDTNGATDVFVYDRQTGTVELVSVGSDGTQGEQESSSPAISGDGRFVAFDSDATTLVLDDTNETSDVFVHDRVTGTTERVSLDTDGGQSLASSFAPSISLDGRYVTFLRGATPGFEVWLHDRYTGSNLCVSRAIDGSPANGSSFTPRVTTSPVLVVFESAAGNLLVGDADPSADATTFDVFVASDVPPVTSTTITATTTSTTASSTSSSTAAQSTTTSVSRSTSTSSSTTLPSREGACTGRSPGTLACLLERNAPPPACAGVRLGHRLLRGLRRAQRAAIRIAEHGPRPPLLRRVEIGLRSALHALERRRRTVPAPCAAAIEDVAFQVRAIVQGLRASVDISSDPSAKITPRLADALAVAQPGDLLSIYAGIGDPRDASGAPVRIEDVVKFARTPIIPGVRYLKVVGRESLTPLAHALRAAGCQNVAAFWAGGSVFADCTPATIQALAARSNVFEVDLDQL